jgi:hypothetical protein
MDLLAFIRENALSHMVILIWVIIRYILNTNVGQYSPFNETYSLGLDFLSKLWNIGVRVSAFRNKYQICRNLWTRFWFFYSFFKDD